MEQSNCKVKGFFAKLKSKAQKKPIVRLKAGTNAKLSQLHRGQTGRVTAIRNDNAALRRRLLDMGITRGVEITIKKLAPLGDPVDVLVRGYELCLRKSDMANIDVEVVA